MVGTSLHISPTCCMLSHSVMSDSVTPWTVAHQVPLSMELSRQEFWLLLFSCEVVSDFLPPHELQHTRLPHPSLSPGVSSNSRPLSQWCDPTISFSVTPFFSCPPSIPASGSFPVSWLFTSSGQSTEATASVSVVPMNIQDRFPLRLTILISLQSKGLSRVSSSTTVLNHQLSGAQPSLSSIFTHDYWKNHSFD